MVTSCQIIPAVLTSSSDWKPWLPTCSCAACIFVCLLNHLESRCWGLGKMINKMYALSKWMWPLSHGDVTFQQKAEDEMLSEDFVPPGCMAECWVQGCWPRHSITSASAAAAVAAAALRWCFCPSLTYPDKIQAPLIKPLKIINTGLFCSSEKSLQTTTLHFKTQI